jgi:hypothetical protein
LMLFSGTSAPHRRGRGGSGCCPCARMQPKDWGRAAAPLPTRLARPTDRRRKPRRRRSPRRKLRSPCCRLDKPELRNKRKPRRQERHVCDAPDARFILRKMPKWAIVETLEMFVWEETIMSKRGQPRLYERLTLTTLTIVMGLGGAAQAATYGGGPVLSPPGSTLVSCRLFNFGPNPVALDVLQIFSAAGTLVTPFFNNCPPAPGLVLGASCVFQVTATPGGQYSCRAVVAGDNDDSVSGDIEVSGAGSTLLNNLPLRNSHE